MRNYETARNRVKAEFAIRSMSSKAQEGWRQTSPLELFEYDTEEGPRYAMKGAFEGSGYTFEYIQELFESLVDDWSKEGEV